MTATTKTTELHRLTPQDDLTQAAECLKMLAHPHRLRMVQMLLGAVTRSGNLPRLVASTVPWLPTTYGSCSGAAS